jgi:hypothetical protein
MDIERISNRLWLWSLVGVSTSPLINAVTLSEPRDDSVWLSIFSISLLLSGLFYFKSRSYLLSRLFIITLFVSLMLFFPYSEVAPLYTIMFSLLILSASFSVNFSRDLIPRILFLSLSVMYVTTYVIFRLLFPESAKTDFTNANFNGLICILLGAYCFYSVKAFGFRLGVISLIVLCLAGVAMTSSRAAIVATLILFVISLFSSVRMASFRKVIFQISAFIIICTVLVWFFVPQEQASHIFARFTEEEFIGDPRFVQIVAVLNIIYDDPLFLLLPIPEEYVATYRGVGFSDNSVLELAGYIGVFFAVVLFSLFFYLVYRRWGAVSMCVFLFACFTYNVVLMTPFVTMFILLMAGIENVLRVQRTADR